MNQTRLASLMETLFSTAVGYGIAVLINLYCLPWWGFHPDVRASTGMAILFTVASIIRQYWVRRAFNAGLHTLILKFASKLLSFKR
jgi:hypothetical protein